MQETRQDNTREARETFCWRTRRRFNLFFVCYFRRLNLKDSLLLLPLVARCPFLLNCFSIFVEALWVTGTHRYDTVAVYPVRRLPVDAAQQIPNKQTSRKKKKEKRRFAALPLLLQPTTFIAAAVAVAEQNTFIMSTADPFEELLGQNRNNCLETLNKTETVYKPGKFFLLFSLSFAIFFFQITSLQWPPLNLQFVSPSGIGRLFQHQKKRRFESAQMQKKIETHF